MSTPNESPVERIKKASEGLRGTLAESLLDEHTGAIREDDQTLIKFHGMYMQDDRDRREERAAKKLDRLYSFMIRLRLPGGYLNAQQWEALHNITSEHATHVIKITTRQTVQLHGILRSHIKPVLSDFNKVHLDSIAACGDVNRNVTCSAHPKYSAVHEEVFGYADKISTHLLPKTKAYYEVWLDEEKLAEVNEEDPLYENRYLPRKFKIAIAIPPYNDVDLYTNDIGLTAIIEKEKLIGFNVAAGGGMGTTHGNPDTYPRLATAFGYVPKKDILKVVYEIATVQRDNGNRSDRKLSRLKYTIDKMGIDVFKAEVERRAGVVFAPLKKAIFTYRHDEYGWFQNHEGLWYYTAFVENGRLLDDDNVQYKTAFLTIAKSGKAAFRFTTNQNIIISEIAPADKEFVAAILEQHNIIKVTTEASQVRKNAMACVSFNTCPLALAEAQRYLPDLITKIETVLAKHQLQEEGINIRMTGCPNGCARPYISEIGFIGTAYGRYNMHLGADVIGTRLNKLYKENLNEVEILDELDILFGNFVQLRHQKESFGDFVVRQQYV
ncbi:NADPH-dependent assimilatory sulfite reductase hemoprotein subunit [Limnovirga soli]|uniref:assimilatory sulfite reductase (NADPH) n=1 Tax=Limnovirga soli TaxID=2656915 RepID=A0A8J8FDW8_9BACT|nr:NADPH-dependent assimilatory sulfite reductase hemoprotein subunit [Limnovirga soli]NNV54832.1 NADPH-dependent assimilatory sulfite reductase hemoprotein subunit [Limnovirga soli]